MIKESEYGLFESQLFIIYDFDTCQMCYYFLTL